MASCSPAGDEPLEIDPSHPFKGIIVCCTSIPPEHRTDIAQKVADLGGVHKYDLTPDVTHLIVGDYDTPKYRHVARERPDIKAMDAGWVEAVNDLWKRDEDDVDLPSLEARFRLKPLETCGAEQASREDGPAAARGSLLVCLTGFGDRSDEIAESIRAAGGRHTGDLTRRCTHLIAAKPEGKKFAAARSWRVHTVTLDWLTQSVERGMILEEAKFDPMLPPEEQGVDAWVKRPALKRARSSLNGGAGGEESTRKLRKTASMKLSFQTSHIWGDILGRPSSGPNIALEPQAQPEASAPTIVDEEKRGVFSRCTFFVHGFPPQRAGILEQTIVTMGGSVVSSLSHLSTTGESFLLVPQTSQPETHPTVPRPDIHVVTEFYVETCLHGKRFVLASEHVLGQPFPCFPIPGFSSLTVCSAAFTGIRLHHVSRSVAQLGAKYEEAFRKSASVLVCSSLAAVRREKLKLALDWGVPVVPGEWLWECIRTGSLAPIDDFIYDELRSQYPKESKSRDEQESRPKTKLAKPTSRDPFASEESPPKELPNPSTNSNRDPFAPEESPPKADPSRPKPGEDFQESPSNRASAAEESPPKSKGCDLTTALSSLIPQAAQEDPRPRRRKILGRASSTASTCASALVAAPEEEEEDVAPPATQLEYGDKEAVGYKAALMSRMAERSKSLPRSLRKR